MSADADDVSELHDRVISHIFGSGLTLAGVLSLHRVDAEVAERLRDVIDALDAAAAELRSAAFSRVLEASDAESTERQVAVPAEVRRRLSRFSFDEIFAYAVNSYDFYRAADHTLWAHESDGLLLSARSGTPLARRAGKVFYDIDTDLPLYYEDQDRSVPRETGSSDVLD